MFLTMLVLLMSLKLMARNQAYQISIMMAIFSEIISTTLGHQTFDAWDIIIPIICVVLVNIGEQNIRMQTIFYYGWKDKRIFR